MYFQTAGDVITVFGTDASETITLTDLGLDPIRHVNKASVSRNGRVVTTFYNFHQFIINGYGGADTISVVSSKPTLLQPVTINGGAGNDVLTGAKFNSGSINANGGSGDDSITGTANADIINGGSGKNILNGASGDDLFIKESAALQGATANDQIDGGMGSDTIKWVELTGETTPDFGSNVITNVENDTFEDALTPDAPETGQPPIF